MFGISLTRFPRQRIYKTPPVAIAPEGRDGALKVEMELPKVRLPRWRWCSRRQRWFSKRQRWCSRGRDGAPKEGGGTPEGTVRDVTPEGSDGAPEGSLVSGEVMVPS